MHCGDQDSAPKLATPVPKATDQATPKPPPETRKEKTPKDRDKYSTAPPQGLQDSRQNLEVAPVSPQWSRRPLQGTIEPFCRGINEIMEMFVLYIYIYI